MPELGPPNNFALEINEAKKAGYSNKKWKEISERYNRKKMGSGVESFVIDDKDENKYCIMIL